MIRRATPADAAAVLDCLREAFEPYRAQYTPDGFADTVLSPQTLAHRMATMTVFVAVDAAEQVIGTIACHRSSEREGHLRGMAVLSSAQGQGIAAALIRAAEAELFGSGCERITLDTTKVLHRAMRFYESQGYARTGVISDFFGMELIEWAKSLDQR